VRGYVYAMHASPRKGGNTDTLMGEVLEELGKAGMAVVEEDVGRDPVNPCRGCNRCGATGECVQKDRMQEIYPHLVAADAVILAAPVFSMHVCAQAKAVIDRCQRFWAVKYVLKRHLVEDEERRGRRKGLFISACGRDFPATFDCVRPTVAYFFHVLEIGTWESLQFAGVDEMGAIRAVPGALERAREMGRWLAEGVRAT
jgi:hypothetical protein